MNNFTPRAMQVLALARKEAVRLQFPRVGTEHLLLGLFKLNAGVSVNVLGRMGLDAATLGEDLEKLLGSGEGVSKLMPYTVGAKDVFTHAGEEAKRLNHSYIGTEHLLLGMLRGKDDDVVVQVFKTHGIDLEKVRMEVLKELDPTFSGPILTGLSPTFAPEYASLMDKVSGLFSHAQQIVRVRTITDDAKLTRDQLLAAFEKIMDVLDSIKADIVQMRSDVLKENT